MLYMLMAVGFTMAFGIMRIVNFAHGEFYMIGAFTGFYLVVTWGLPFVVAILAAGVVAGTLGAILERSVFRHFEGDELNGMIAALGISVILQNVALMIWGPTSRTFESPFNGVIHLAGIAFPADRLFALAAAAAIFLAFWLMTNKTQLGRAIRALAQDRDVALLQGIRAGYVYPVAFAIAVGMAGMAGALMSPVFAVSPFAGLTPMLKAFVVVILGGLGSIPGAIVGGLLLGLMESLAGTLLGGAVADAMQLLLVIGLLLFRPWGMLGQREREA
jgi:branched-chain amino acid transport system permease protein